MVRREYDWKSPFLKWKHIFFDVPFLHLKLSFENLKQNWQWGFLGIIASGSKVFNTFWKWLQGLNTCCQFWYEYRWYCRYCIFSVIFSILLHMQNHKYFVIQRYQASSTCLSLSLDILMIKVFLYLCIFVCIHKYIFHAHLSVGSNPQF